MRAEAGQTVVAPELYVEVLQFLYHEADLLDNGRFDDWLELLDDEIEYEMPLTLTRERAEQARVHASAMEYLSENIESLKMRVARLKTEYAWAEDPPSRTRHVVGNVQVDSHGDGELRVRSAFCVFVNRGEWTYYRLFVGSREDLLARRNGGLTVRKRRIYLDQATLGPHSISIFL
jgi:3-phenylpropionate/cinnamic acid dioxygenase small subunit